MKQEKVLVFPGSTEIGLEIFKCLHQVKGIELFSADQDYKNHSRFVFKNNLIVPTVHSNYWLDELNKIIVQNGIDLIFPAHDDVIVSLTSQRDNIPSMIISSPVETCVLTRSKSLTYNFFKDILPVPDIYTQSEQIKEFPIFAKPDRGHGSRNTHIISNMKQYLEMNLLNNSFVFTEYLPGSECTVDCFSDRDKGLLFCNPRMRTRIRNGISMNSVPITDKREIKVLQQYAEIINSKLSIFGAWFFQVKKDISQVYKILEIAPRVSGTMAIQRVRGINLPLLSIYEAKRVPYEIMFNDIDIEIDRALVNRYKHNVIYDRVYVDLDDTLILNDKLNIKLITFLYQCINKKIPITLITKHKYNLKETLLQNKLFELFDEILHIPDNVEKWKFITNKRSIFIDDSFSERKSVSQQIGIPTFDCSMIELLIEDI